VTRKEVDADDHEARRLSHSEFKVRKADNFMLEQRAQTKHAYIQREIKLTEPVVACTAPPWPRGPYAYDYPNPIMA
jgi:hypothetical protein